jgi:uncharacterized GH25 family protein
MASYSNLFVDQGADFSTFVTITSTENDALDLTDLSIKGQIRKSYGSSTAFDFTIVKTDNEGGQIQIKLDSDTSGSMSIGRYVYDVYAENTNSDRRFKIIEGILEIVPRVTRFSV